MITILGPVQLFAAEPACTYSIVRGEDDEDRAPRVVFHSGAEGLTRAEWDYVADAIRSAWQSLSVLCVCGHSLWSHGASSPHACAHPGGCCSCRCFSSEEPTPADTLGFRAPTNGAREKGGDNMS